MLDDTPDMPVSVWTIVDRELHKRRKRWSALGAAIGASDQVLYNWKMRQKIPANWYLSIADYFGWSVEQLVGVAEPPASAPEPPPEPVYSKRANDLARMFDDLKDPKVKQAAYAVVQNVLQMAKAGQKLPPPPEVIPEPPAPPKARPAPKIPKRALAPKKPPHPHQ